MNVAVIDSGLDFASDNYNIIGSVDFCCDRWGGAIDLCGHGTAVTKYINRSIKGVGFYIVKILDADNRSNSERLLYALQHLLEVDVKLVVVCVATVKNSLVNDIQNAINLLSEQNKIVISSLYNGKKCSYPACLDNVIGVKGLPYNIDKCSYIKNKSIQCTTNSSLILLKGRNRKFSMLDGNSKATALFTILLLKMFVSGRLQDDMTFEDVEDSLDKMRWFECNEREQQDLSKYIKEYQVFIEDIKNALGLKIINDNDPVWKYLDTTEDIERIEYHIGRNIDIDFDTIVYKKSDFASFEKLFVKLYFES